MPDTTRLGSHDDAEDANVRFNYFRGGVVKAIRVVSGNAFLTDAQWARQAPLLDPDVAVQQQTDRCLLNTLSVELEIHHYQYGDPRQPRCRAIFVRADEVELASDVMACVGKDVFELVFDWRTPGIVCTLTVHASGFHARRTMANGRTAILFSAPEVIIDEGDWGGGRPDGASDERPGVVEHPHPGAGLAGKQGVGTV